MAEMMDSSLLVPGVMDIIGGLGLIQSLEDAVDAAAAALDGGVEAFFHSEAKRKERGTPVKDRGTSEPESETPEPHKTPSGVSSEPCSGDISSTKSMDESSSETASRDDGGDPLVTTPAGENEMVAPEKNSIPLNVEVPEPQTEPMNEMPEISAQEPIQPPAQSPAEPLTDSPSECPTEPLTQPELEVHPAEASAHYGPVDTSLEQVEQVVTSEVRDSSVSEGTDHQPNGVEPAMEEAEPSAKAQSENQEESGEEEEEEGEEEEQKESSKDSQGNYGSSPCYGSESSEEIPPGTEGKKKSVGRHNYSKYNTVSYRTIRKGNTRQRIDEFESMIHT